jgi:Domain of unknown function (DUF4190)
VTTEHSTTPATQSGQHGLAIASLVTGIVGVVFAFLFAIIGLALGVVSVALGAVARRNSPSGKATAGLVLGAVAVVLAIVNMVIAYNVLT